jgi:hypothetical protein
MINFLIKLKKMVVQEKINEIKLIKLGKLPN